MKGVRIFAHSVLQVTGNLGVAARISVLPMLMIVGASLLVGAARVAVAQGDRGTGFALIAGAVVVSLFAASWMAVAWHRFVLTGEDPGILLRVDGATLIRYLLRTMLIALIAGVAGMLFSYAVAVLLATLRLPPGLTPLILMVPMVALTLRLSVSLPGVALGEPVSLAQGWAAITGQAGPLLTLAALVAAASAALSLPLFFLPGIAAVIWQVIQQWATTLLGLSVLTTLYGHFIQRRALR